MTQEKSDPLEKADRDYLDAVRSEECPTILCLVQLIDRYLPQPLPWWEELVRDLKKKSDANGVYTVDYIVKRIRKAAYDAGE